MDYLKNTLPTIGGSAQKYLDGCFAKESALPTLLLMEQAAEAVTRFILRLTLKAKPKEEAGLSAEDLEYIKSVHPKILFLAGCGNNAGDAWVAARQLLAYHFSVQVLDLFPEKALPDDAQINKTAYRMLGGKIRTRLPEQSELEAYSFIVDGIFGTGFSIERPLTGKIPGILSRINVLKTPVRIAIDIPTGVEADSGAVDQIAFQADYTVTFSTYKTGNFADPGNRFCGEVSLAPISMHPYWLERKIHEFEIREKRKLPRILTANSFRDAEVKRGILDHKGKFGKSLLIGGSNGMPGAVLLALRAAHATGVGYVYTRVGRDIYDAILQASPESLTDICPYDEQSWQELITSVDSVLIGPGAGKSDYLQQALPVAVQHAEHLIIDADGLNFLAEMEDWPKLFNKRKDKEPAVLTPHPKEFQRLAPDLTEILEKDRQAAALALAQRSRTIVVLKGHNTVIALPDGEIYLNSSGNQGLARAGSGDVLAGLAAGFSAQYQEQRLAICLAVYLHGLLADLAVEELGIRGITPDLLTGYLKQAYQVLHWQN